MDRRSRRNRASVHSLLAHCAMDALERRQLLSAPVRLMEASFDYTQAGSQGVVYRFSDAVSSGLSASNFSLIDIETGSAPANSTPTVTFPDAATAKVTFPGMGAILSKGSFQLTLSSASPSLSNVYRFEFQPGDFDRDLKANSIDFNILAGNFGATGAKYTQGDMTGDGLVNNDDYTLFFSYYADSVKRMDVSIDSDNTSAGSPERNGSETDIEESIGRPGKIITVNNGDIDLDGIPDFADGYNRDGSASNDDTATGLKFVPLQLTLPSGLTSSAIIKLTYDSSDPSSGATTSDTPAAGWLRLWKKDGSDATRTVSDFVAGGTSGTTYTLAQFQALGTTLYVEAVRPSPTLAEQSIIVEVDPDGNAGTPGKYMDTVRLTAVRATPSYFNDPLADRPGGTATGADSSDPMTDGFSGVVRYADGSVFFTSSDLDPAEGGIVSGHTRTWNNSRGQGIDALNGAGWSMAQWPSLIQATSSMILVAGGRSSQWFDYTGSAYVARDFSLDRLVVDGTGYRVTDTLGNKFYFHGFGSSIASLQRGQLDRYVDSAGNETKINYTAAGLPNTVERKRLSDSAILERLTYSYNGINQLTGMLMERRNDLNAGAVEAVRNVEYEYYGGSDTTYGNPGNLKRVTVKQSGNAVERKLYRYDNYGRLILVLEGASYERALGREGMDPASVNQATLQPYANLVLDYYAADDSTVLRRNRVKTQTIQGSGTFSYDYAGPSSSTTGGRSGVNTWDSKTIESLPDSDNADLSNNDKNVVYTNSRGEVLLTSYSSPTATTAATWNTANQFDAKGRLTLTATPTAVASISDSNNHPATLQSATGLVHTFEYDPASATGYLWRTGRKQGTGGSQNLQVELTYSARPSATGGTPTSSAFVVASDTVYRSDASASAVTTSYSYSYSSDRITQRTTTLPDILQAQNGGTQTTSKTEIMAYDSFGRETSFTDGDGKVATNQYFDATGALKQSVVDSGGAPLTTGFEADLLGRNRKITDANTYMGLSTGITRSEYDDSAALKRVTITPPLPSSGNTPPAHVIIDNRATGVLDEIDVVRDSSGDLLSTVTKRTRTEHNIQQQATAVERFADTSGNAYTASTGALTGTTTRYRTEFGYDERGRQTRQAAGRDLYTGGSLSGFNPTITRTVYDGLDRAISTWVGTDDSSWSPGSPGTNMTKVTANEYDGGSVDGGNVGDDTLTKVTQIPGGSNADRVTAMRYDWRDRLVLTHEGVTSDTTVNSPITLCVFDNLDRCVGKGIYDGDGQNINSLNLGTVDSTLSAQRRAYQDTLFDDRGNVYEVRQYSVEQEWSGTAGTKGNYLTTSMWYDNRGNLIKQRNPGGLNQKMVYDGASRETKRYTTDGKDDPAPGASGNYTAAGSVSDDVVLEQVETSYDGNGNPTLIATGQRDHDKTDLGDLTSLNARISLVGNYYDSADRLTNQVNWGNNGDDGDANANGVRDFSRPSTAPGRDTAADGWDRWLQTDYVFDTAGRLQDVVSPRGVVTRTTYDALDRATIVQEGYRSSAPTADDTRKTLYTYNGFDQQTQIETTTYKSNTAYSYITTYNYGVTKNSTILVNHSGLLSSVVYGRPAGAYSGSGHREVMTGYTALGENRQQKEEIYNLSTSATQKQIREQRFNYDTLGRLTLTEWIDAASKPANMLDRGQKIRTRFDALSRGIEFTTLDSGTTVKNQVIRDFDGLGNLVTEWQEHKTSVARTGGTPSQKVQYVYTTDFGNNLTRLAKTVYPDGREVGVVYGYQDYTTSSTLVNFSRVLNDRISRVGFMVDGDPSTAVNNDRLERYEYLGLNRIVERNMPRVLSAGGVAVSFQGTTYIYDLDPASAVTMDWNQVADDAGRVNDQYGGLDRFGRVVIHDVGLEQRAYGYDADGNVLYSWLDSQDNFNGRWRSELYGSGSAPANQVYDQLGRVQSFVRGDGDYPGNFTYWLNTGSDKRGRLTSLNAPSVTTDSDGDPLPISSQNWDNIIDASVLTRDRSGTNTFDPPARLVFQRPVPTGNSPIQSTPVDNIDQRIDVFVQYDGLGRLASKTTVKLDEIFADPGNSQYQYAYDIPNAHTLTFDYDALGRRISETNSTQEVTGYQGTLHLFYDAAGNVIEEKQEQIDGTYRTQPQNQYVWSAGEPGRMVLRDNDDGSRVWVYSGPDGSVWRIREDFTSLAINREMYTYTTEGQVAVGQSTGTSTFDYKVDQYGRSTSSDGYRFRYLWRGGRDDGDGMLWMPNQTEHDSYRGTPQTEDGYAYQSYTAGGFFDGKNVEWTGVQEKDGFAGTQGQWSNPSTLDAWTDFSGKYDAFRPSAEWNADPYHLAKISGWAGTVALTVASGGTSALWYLAAGTAVGGAGGAIYSASTGADYWKSVEVGTNIGALAGSFPGAISRFSTTALRYADEGAQGALMLFSRTPPPALSIIGGQTVASVMGGGSTAASVFSGAAVNWGGVVGVGSTAVYSLSGSTPSGMVRNTSGYRARYGPAAMRQHHLVPQQLLKNSTFSNRLRALGYDPRKFVDQRITEIPYALHKTLHPEWNKQWELFANANPNFGVADIERQVKLLSEMYLVPRASRNFIRMYGR